VDNSISSSHNVFNNDILMDKPVMAKKKPAKKVAFFDEDEEEGEESNISQP
jgi:hypothetical protein